jgi:large subunit ribosomal protein L6
MSRVGKQPIQVPAGTKVSIEVGRVSVAGPKGTLGMQVGPLVEVTVDGAAVKVARREDTRQGRAAQGLTRQLVANLVTGVSSGFRRVLEINGVGYRAEVKGPGLQLALGYSHPIVFSLPQGVHATVDKQTVITLESADRQVLGEVAAAIRKLRPPEPYKGKGIKYAEETIRRKAGKAVGAAS